MRSKNRLRNTDFKKIQTSLKQKAQRQRQTLMNLMDLPDCDVPEFLQQLMKNQNYEQILQQIPEQKKIDFFAKNYKNFLQTQQQLSSFKLPYLPQIPKARQFHLKLKQQVKIEQDPDQANVIQIIDSFSTHVLQKNTQQVLRLHKIIMDMKEHSRYGKYFYKYSINKNFRQNYVSFVQNCRDLPTLMKLKEIVQAIRVFLQEKQTQIFAKINGDLGIDSSVHSLKKTLRYLLQQIQHSNQSFRVKFQQYINTEPQLALYFSKWINKLAVQYYRSIQRLIYQEQEIASILQNLSQILQTSKQIQTKGISLYRQLRTLIATDLPSHLQKILEVVLQQFDNLLKYDNQLFQFVEVKQLGQIAQKTQNLNIITKKDFDKKCCSRKGILLINSFMVILLPLCDEKWAFLHENVLGAIIDKVKALLQQEKVKLPMWDCYHLFMFFFNLGKGKIKHHTLFDPQNCAYLKERILKIKKLTDQCRFVFENTLIQNFWTDVLSHIPSLLWQFKQYAQVSEKKKSLKPTTFSIELVFRIEEFFKQLQFRMSKQHFEYMALQFYEYLVYTIEYIIFWAYHEKGANSKVFTLYKKQQKFLNKAKQTFPIQQLTCIKNKQVLKLSCFTKFGLQRFVIDFYFLSDAYKIIVGRCEKIKADEFLYKVSKILAKEQKNESLDTERKKYDELLKSFIDVYEKSPEVIKKYLNDKKKADKVSMGSSSAGNQARESRDRRVQNSQNSQNTQNSQNSSQRNERSENNSRTISEESSSPTKRSRY